MTKILALDASTELCSVALWQNGNILERVSTAPRSHANRLLPMVEEVLAESGLALKQLDAIAFGAGPGSFTGLRICAGIVQGLAFGANLRVVAVSSLQAMAMAAHRQYPQSPQVVPAIDARMGEIYWARYELTPSEPETLEHPQVTPVAELDASFLQLLRGADTVGVGSGWELLGTSRKLLSQCSTHVWPQAGAIAQLADGAFQRGEHTDAMGAQPVYLRTEISWKKRERIRR